MILEYIWRATIAIAAAVGAYIAIALKQRRSFKLATSAGDSVALLDSPILETAIDDKHLCPTHINIEFPQLSLSNADTWGTDEEFIAVCQLLDENGNPIVGRSIQVHIRGNKVEELTTNNQGSCSIRYTFRNKGAYNIDFRFEDDEEFISCSHQRMIRIVDYRQEVAQLFNTMKKSAISNGAVINEQLTPRDVGATLLHTFTDIDSEKLDKFICYVEESLYSSHHFDSKRYSDTLSNYPGDNILVSP